MQRPTRFSPAWRIGAVILAVVLLAGACSSSASQAPAASGGGASAAPASAATGASGAAAGTKHVAILNQDMTDDQIKAEIKKEGGLTVGNWTYTATDELVNQFQKYVKATYGEDVKLTYVGSQSPSEYLTKLAAAKNSNSETPFDVIAVEENYWQDAVDQDLVDSFLPSDLVPNESLLLDGFKHEPTALAFQAASFIALVYNKSKQPWIKSFKDLADPRLKGKVTVPPPGDISSGGLLLALSKELGKDYKDPEQMKEVVDWLIANIGPNLVNGDKYTSTESELQQLMDSGTADAEVFWNGQTRLEYFSGNKDVSQVVPAALFPINGYVWIPKKAPHPVLAQVFINWRLAPEVQFPNDWNIEHGPWTQLSEGFLGDSYVSHVPDWFKSDYYNNYLTIDQIKSSLQTIDWKAFNASSKVFQDYFAQKLGQ
jgi:ABC-type Fe3+ transport system substrate-binding protein